MGKRKSTTNNYVIFKTLVLPWVGKDNCPPYPLRSYAPGVEYVGNSSTDAFIRISNRWANGNLQLTIKWFSKTLVLPWVSKDNCPPYPLSSYAPGVEYVGNSSTDDLIRTISTGHIQHIKDNSEWRLVLCLPALNVGSSFATQRMANKRHGKLVFADRKKLWCEIDFFFKN